MISDAQLQSIQTRLGQERTLRLVDFEGSWAQCNRSLNEVDRFWIDAACDSLSVSQAFTKWFKGSFAVSGETQSFGDAIAHEASANGLSYAEINAIIIGIRASDAQWQLSGED